ncbi:MAG: hypothetical protein DSZ05_01495 [Sulfurospirillum sp.]|nr:MAG: hypothetical protein DSZ05_01495 [Sulfurospirillum sp.]
MKMALCLVAALLLGMFFGYLYTRRKTKEMYEDKLDALEELCESKKSETHELKTKYGSMEVDMLRLQEINKEHEETILEKQKVIEEQEEKLASCKQSDEKISALENMYESKKSEAEQLKKECEGYSAKIKKLEEECSEYKERIASYEKQAEKDAVIISGYQNREKELATLEKEYEAKKEELEKLKKEYTDIDSNVQKLQDTCKSYEQEIESYKESILFYQNSADECKKHEEEMLAQIEVLVKKNDMLEQKIKQVAGEHQKSEIHEERIDTETIIGKLGEINDLLQENGELVPQHVKNEIIQEVESFKEEITHETKGSKIVNFLQNIVKKIRE